MFTEKRQLSTHLYDFHAPVHYTDATGVTATAPRIEGKVLCPVTECGLLLATQRNFHRHLKRAHEIIFLPSASGATLGTAPQMVPPTTPDLVPQVEAEPDATPIVSAAPLQDGMSYATNYNAHNYANVTCLDRADGVTVSIPRSKRQ